MRFITLKINDARSKKSFRDENIAISKRRLILVGCCKKYSHIGNYIIDLIDFITYYDFMAKSRIPTNCGK